MKTGERIKTIRKSQGITQAKLAETLHISSSFMSRIEMDHLVSLWTSFVRLQMHFRLHAKKFSAMYLPILKMTAFQFPRK